MEVDKKRLRDNIEEIIAEGVMEAEEVDITADKIMDEIEILIRVVEGEPVNGF